MTHSQRKKTIEGYNRALRDHMGTLIAADEYNTLVRFNKSAYFYESDIANHKLTRAVTIPLGYICAGLLALGVYFGISENITLSDLGIGLSFATAIGATIASIVAATGIQMHWTEDTYIPKRDATLKSFFESARDIVSKSNHNLKFVTPDGIHHTGVDFPEWQISSLSVSTNPVSIRIPK